MKSKSKGKSKGKNILVLVAVALGGICLGVTATWYLGSVFDAVSETHGEDEDSNHEEHTGHTDDEDEGHDERDEEDVVQLSEAEMKEFGVTVGTAAAGKLKIHASLPGEIVANADHLAHIVPRVPGVVREVKKKLGDTVAVGEVMAVIESRDLADVKAAYLAATERVRLAKANFAREENLWKKKISSEQEYLGTKQALAEARIELLSIEQQLHALGFSDKYLEQLSHHSDKPLTRYEIIAPFDGTVIEKHITIGEVLQDDSETFVIADMSTVWVDLSIYQKDLPLIRKDQPVLITAGHGIPDARGTISYVGPVVDEKTRTALARIVLPNPDRHWRPGVFVTAQITVDNIDVPILVPRTAFQTIEGKTCVFVQTAEGFEPKPVTVGRTNSTHAQVTSGLTLGQRYVTAGAFTLKAQLSKGAFGDGHAGH